MNYLPSHWNVIVLLFKKVLYLPENVLITAVPSSFTVWISMACSWCREYCSIDFICSHSSNVYFSIGNWDDSGSDFDVEKRSPSTISNSIW